MSLNTNKLEIEYVNTSYAQSGDLDEVAFYHIVRIKACCENTPLTNDFWINCGYKDKEPILYFLLQETDELGDRIQKRWLFCPQCGAKINMTQICEVRREKDSRIHTITTKLNLMNLEWPKLLAGLKEL